MQGTNVDHASQPHTIRVFLSVVLGPALSCNGIINCAVQSSSLSHKDSS